jgi:hypothetical protein
MPDLGDQLTADDSGHVVQFYGDDQELAASVARFLGEGLEAGGTAVVVATAAHRLVFRAHLPSAAGERLLIVDAQEMLHRFLVGGQLDGQRFREMAEHLIGRAAKAGQPVRIYAEMVAVLWDAGQVTLALELESLWNDLATRLPFSLLCGYPARLLATDDGNDAAGVQQVCRLHTAVTGPSPGRISGASASRDGSGDNGIAVRQFSSDLASARAVREFVITALGWRLPGADGTDAVIVAAELAANAVLHARSAFTVSVSHLPQAVRISVEDQVPLSGSPPVARPGHGLHMVAQVAARWAVDPLPGGKAIWAELPAPPLVKQ